jgi:hypothetical protein
MNTPTRDTRHARGGVMPPTHSIKIRAHAS